MLRVVPSVLVLLLSALIGSAQQSASSTPAPAPNGIRAAIPVVLTESLDAKKLKAGDEVTAKTLVGLEGKGLSIPSGSKVTGHVTQAEARSKGDPQSSLGIVFDKIDLSGGKERPIHGQIQAVAPSAIPEPTVGPVGGGTIAKESPGDQGSPVPGPSSSLGNIQTPNPDGSANQPWRLDANSHGVIGIRHLELDKDSVLTTTDKDLKLDSGTQLLVRSEIQSPGQ